MDVILSTEGIDIQECDVLVTGFFQDERSLKRSSGWIGDSMECYPVSLSKRG
jgi:hypothetical protein